MLIKLASKKKDNYAFHRRHPEVAAFSGVTAGAGLALAANNFYEITKKNRRFFPNKQMGMGRVLLPMGILAAGIGTSEYHRAKDRAQGLVS